MERIFFLHIFGVFILVVNGSHFLGGTITWHPLNESATGTPIAVVITQTYSWTYSLMPCTSAMIAGNQLVPAYGGVASQTLVCISNCGAPATGYSPINIIPYCTDFSSPVGTTVGQRSDIVYLQSDDDFTIAFQGSAWRLLSAGSGSGWSIATNINLQLRSDTDLYNNAPVATMMSPINIPANQPTVINVPVGDADGDPLRCRWSTSTNGVDECGGVCPPGSLPTGTVIYPNCTIVITGPTVGNWFGVTLMVEDFINSTSTIPLSSVPVQFLIQVVGAASCSIPPQIIGLPLEDSCTSVIVGQQYTSELIAINNCGPSVTITDIATLSFSGMVKGDLAVVNSTEYYKNLTWIPTNAQLGYQVMCVMAFDSQNAQSAQYCFKFYVSENGVCSCPGDPCITTTSTTTTTATTTSSTSSTSTSSTSTSTSTTSSTSSTSTSTSTTSTTSTSSTSTSSTSTTSTTATTTTKKPDPINWPLIGGIIGLVLLGALTLLSYLLWRFCCLPGILGSHTKFKGMIELYHIEECVDPACHWSYRTSASDIFFTCRNPYTAVNSSRTTRSKLSKSSSVRKVDPIEDIHQTETIVLPIRSALSTIGGHSRRPIMSSVSAEKDKLDIKHRSDTSKKVMNNAPTINQRNRDNIKVSRVKTATTQRATSTNHRGRREKRHNTNKSANVIHSSFQPASATTVRVNQQLHSTQSLYSQNTESAGNFKKTSVTVIRLPSAHRQMNDNITDQSLSSIHFQRVQKELKNTKKDEFN